jgi:hypothetical protein
MIVKYGTDADAVFSRNVDKTKKTYTESLVLYSVIIEYEIFPELSSDVLPGDYSVFSASFNVLLYFFLLASLGNARIFLQNSHRKHFFSSFLLDVEEKVFTTNR